MAIRPFSPTIPGVTETPAWARGAPEPRRALRPTRDDGTPRSEREIGRSIVDVCKNAYRAHEWYYQEAQELGAMLGGAQFGFWNRAQQRFVTIADSEDENIIRITVNVMAQAVQQATSILTSERPIFGAVAATSEGRDTAAAEISDALVEHVWLRHRLSEMYRDTADGSFGRGTDFVLVEWDPSRGGYETETVMDEETGEPVSRVKPRGDCKFTRLQRDQVAFDATAKHPQDGAFASVRRKMSRAYLIECYPEKADELRKGMDPDSTYERSEDHIARYSPVTGRADAVGGEEDDLTVYTVYYAATRDMPRGRALIVTDEGMILHDGDNDMYPTQEEEAEGEMWPRCNWPIFTIRADTRGNSPWGRSRCVDAVPIQKALNGAFSKAIQHTALIANAKPFLPSRLDFRWSDSPGQVIRYPKGMNPNSFGYLSPPPMPDYMLIVRDGREIIESIIGINKATGGGAPSADPSGRLAESLQRQDESRLAPIKEAIDNTWAEIMTYAVRLMRRYVETPRRIQIVGENGVTAMRMFDRSALAAGTDVRVYNDQSIPREPSRRMIWLMNFFQILSQAQDEQQRVLLLDLVRLRDVKGYLEKQNPHRVRAQRMVRQIQLGDIPMPKPWDHPLTFRATIEEYLCSEDFDMQVAREKREGGTSQTEEIASLLWEHYSEQLAGGMPMGAPSPPAMPGAPMGPESMSEPPVSGEPPPQMERQAA